jgi:hypothetical protein
VTESDLRRFRVLEDENRKLKHIVAEQAIDIKALQEINKKIGKARRQTKSGENDS